MVKKESLITVAGVVWTIAGINILILGCGAAGHLLASGSLAAWQVVALSAGAAAVFFAFHAKMFSPLIDKHAARIRAYKQAKLPLWMFFDVKGYVLMAVMMGGGIALRMSGLVPEWFIAFFYTGIGVALTIAGLSFLLNRVHGAGWKFHGNVLHHLRKA